MVNWGAGPRATQSLILATKANAALSGRTTPDIDDVKKIAKSVLRHRIFPNFKALAEGITSDDIIEELLKVFNIQRSLSKKGCPYDNAVAEATFKIIKTEFVKDYTFDSVEDLKIKLFDYVNWYNNHRIHGSLDYLTPTEFKEKMSD